MFGYTDEQISTVLVLKNSGMSWDDLMFAFNDKFGMDKSVEALRHCYKANKHFHAETTSTINVKNLKSVQHTRRANSKAVKENKAILDYLNAKDCILEELQAITDKLKTKPIISIPKLVKSKHKKNMTLELMLSDIHFGKLTKTFNLEVCRTRIQGLVLTVLEEIEKSREFYNVERIMVHLIGDIIESATMHGLESASGSECSNSKQIQAAIDVLFFEVIVPLASTGIAVDVSGVPGNHDRTEKEKTFNNPGSTNVTWIIYHTLRLLSQQTKLHNVIFEITEGASIVKEVYGKNILVEHGDLAHSASREALEKLMNQRAAQHNKVLHFFRLGHFHEPTVFGRGKVIINGSVSGQDGYSELKGYTSEPVQTLNFYIETNTRPTPFYRSFPIYLK